MSHSYSHCGNIEKKRLNPHSHHSPYPSPPPPQKNCAIKTILWLYYNRIKYIKLFLVGIKGLILNDNLLVPSHFLKVFVYCNENKRALYHQQT